jgi:hypothetical protein
MRDGRQKSVRLDQPICAHTVRHERPQAVVRRALDQQKQPKAKTRTEPSI